MTAQTIYNNSTESINNKLDSLFVKFGKNYLMYDRFRVGHKPDFKDMCTLECLGRILNNTYCYTNTPLCTLLEKINLKIMRNVL